jgi:hypothetical protein
MDRLKQLAASLDAWSLDHRWTRVGRRAVSGFTAHEALQYAGSMAYFLGDEGAEGFVSYPRHERMRINAAALAAAARSADAAPASLRPMLVTFRAMFEDYYSLR